MNPKVIKTPTGRGKCPALFFPEHNRTAYNGGIMDEQFARTEMLLGTAAIETLTHAHVAVVGLGGVGSWCAEALCRTGVGELTLLDQDAVSVTNLNRQTQALRSTLGTGKAYALAHRLADINPNCLLHPVMGRYEAETRASFFSGHYDYIADAIDLVSCKLDLIETAISQNVPVLSALGTGNKLDPTRLQVTDISRTAGCPLARVIRKELRKRGIEHHKVVFSPEPTHRSAPGSEPPPPGRRSIPASVVWVPATAGLLMAATIVDDLIHC